MHTPAVFAVCGAALFAVVTAVPMKRDVVWEMYTEEVVTTVAVTATVWVDATDAPAPTQVYAPPTTSAAPVATSPPAQAPYIPSTPSSSSVFVAPAPSSSSSPQVQAPAPAPTVAPSSPAAPAPAPQSSSVYVPPPPPASSSEYVAPAPAPAPTTSSAPAPPPAPAAPSSAAAPAQSPSAPSGGNSGGKTYSGDITYYEPGLGSCGEYSTDSEPVVALAAGMMQKSYCGSSITISYQGSKQTAKIVDTCPGCSGASLDLSSTLFKAVAPQGDGRVHNVDWWFN